MKSPPLLNTLRKRKSRANESSECRVLHRRLDAENKRIQRKTETPLRRERRLGKVRERKRVRQSVSRDEVVDDGRLPESDVKLLRNFRSKIDKLANNHCPVCNERFPSVEIIQGVCHRCYTEKNDIKKFSFRNNMDPGDVLDELRGLTQVEEMLIAQIFPIVSMYCLHGGGQYAYRGNVINFPQDVFKFATRFPRCPSSLDVFVVRQGLSLGSAFKDFRMRRSVVSRALYWLKNNNHYYSNIVVDEDILRSLLEDGPLDD
jgi:hypothetical protein